MHEGKLVKEHACSLSCKERAATLPFASKAATFAPSMSKAAALGKGLGALISARAPSPLISPTPVVEHGERIQLVIVAQIIPTPLQPRTVFRDENLEELVESIKEHGIIQPLIARKRGDKFELIAGERRWRAAKRAGLSEVPVIVREASDQDVLELALIENLQREDLNPIEEANAFARLAKEFKLRQEDIAQKVGKSRAVIANTMRLLDLHDQVQSWLTQSRISVGHAKVLLSLKSPDEQLLLAEEIIKRNLTVRAAEKLVATHFTQNGTTKPTRSPGSNPGTNALAPAILHLQNRIQQHLATHVSLHHNEKRGRIEIEYYGTDDLQRILGVLGLKNEES
ncbi:MAG: ParB-like partition protein [Chthoniobacteraceae bacterium]|nr:ParB-like partition protein [Chthoniobacteraceae bacterium]